MAFMGAMGSSGIPWIAAFFIGLMTALSPCPMATNITAIAFISRKIENSKHTLLVGTIYAVGRALTYILLTALIVYLGLNIRQVSLFLQQYGEMLLGPFLVIGGLVLLEIIKLPSIGKGNKTQGLAERLAGKGFAGAFLLGVIFALAFCPFSAVLYFGMLVPIALSTSDAALIPLLFGLATGLPVIIASLLLAKGVSWFGKAMNKAQIAEKILRKLAGVLFIAVGAYFIALTLHLIA
jgi:cytochrome c-type biogenesis protein